MGRIVDKTKLICHPLKWDSQQLGLTCGLIDNESYFIENSSSVILDRVLELLVENRDISFVTLKVPGSCTDILNTLVRNNFEIIDVELVYSFSGNKQNNTLGNKIVFTNKVDPVCFIPLAKEMKFSRFFQDRRISKSSAVNLWEESIVNHCQGRADELVIGFVGQKPAGMVTIDFDSDNRVELFMVAVLPEFQGRGVGSDMLWAIMKKYSPEREIIVEASSRNDAANRLYSKAGFVLRDCRYILHLMR